MTLPPPRVSRITCFSSLINIYGQSLSIQCTNIYVQRAQHLRLQYHGIWRPSRLSPVKQVPCQARGRQKPLYTSDLVEIPPPPNPRITTHPNNDSSPPLHLHYTPHTSKKAWTTPSHAVVLHNRFINYQYYQWNFVGRSLPSRYCTLGFVAGETPPGTQYQP